MKLVKRVAKVTPFRVGMAFKVLSNNVKKLHAAEFCRDTGKYQYYDGYNDSTIGKVFKVGKVEDKAGMTGIWSDHERSVMLFFPEDIQIV